MRKSLPARRVVMNRMAARATLTQCFQDLFEDPSGSALAGRLALMPVSLR